MDLVIEARQKEFGEVEECSCAVECKDCSDLVAKFDELLKNRRGRLSTAWVKYAEALERRKIGEFEAQIETLEFQSLESDDFHQLRDIHGKIALLESHISRRENRIRDAEEKRQREATSLYMGDPLFGAF